MLDFGGFTNPREFKFCFRAKVAFAVGVGFATDHRYLHHYIIPVPGPQGRNPRFSEGGSWVVLGGLLGAWA